MKLRANPGITAIIISLSYLPTVNAQNNTPVLEPLIPCTIIADPIKRLTCFDAAMIEARKVAKKTADATPDARIAHGDNEDTNFGLRTNKPINRTNSNAQEVRPETDDFGKSAPQINQERRKKGLESQAQPSLTANIVEHSTDIYGKLSITLNNGQTWRTTGSSDIKRLPAGPLTAIITKSTFGGYRLKIEGVVGTDVVKRIK